MNLDFDTSALRKLLDDPALYRQRCNRAAELQQQIERMAVAAGLGVFPGSEKPTPAPSVNISFRIPVDDDPKWHPDAYDFYRCTMRVSCLVDVFKVEYKASIKNMSPMSIRDEEYLLVESQQPLIRAMAEVEDVLVPELERLGWQRPSLKQLAALFPGVRVNIPVTVERALFWDVRGWLDAEPVRDVLPLEFVPYQAIASTLYARGAEARLVERTKRESWASEIEMSLEDCGGRIERLSPEPYPSVVWSIDFGEIQNGMFHAHFYTDINMSVLAPVWYYTHRFTVKPTLAVSLMSEFHGWQCSEAIVTRGYRKEQTEITKTLMEVFAVKGVAYVSDCLLGWYLEKLPALEGKRDAALFGELLFRDVFGLFPAAPAAEEEHVLRHVRHRIGPL